MKLSKIKESLQQLDELKFVLPSGAVVPSHFHVTEIGHSQKRFVDCGGNLREEAFVTFQLFTADDIDHRLQAKKLKAIIELSEKALGLGDLEVNVEYQGDTVGIYALAFDGQAFLLQPKQTACLANEACGLPEQKPRIRLSDLKNSNTAASCCDPSAACC